MTFVGSAVKLDPRILTQKWVASPDSDVFVELLSSWWMFGEWCADLDYLDLLLKSFWQSFLSQITPKHQHSSCSFLRAEVWADFCMGSLWFCCFSHLFLRPSCLIHACPWLCLPYHSSGRRKEGVSALTVALIITLLAPNPKVVDGGGWFQGGEVQWERRQLMWGESRTVKMIMASRRRASWLWLARLAFAYWHWEAKLS